jgi:hypothetical protein
MSQPSLIEQLVEKGKAGYPALYLYSQEDQRVMGEIRQAADTLKRKMYYWTAGRGLVEDSGPNGRPVPDTELPPGVLNKMKTLPKDSIIVLRQFHDYLGDPLVRGYFLDLIPEFKLSMRMFIVLSPVVVIPPELEKDLSLVEAPMPDEAVLDGVLEGITKNLKEDQRPNQVKRGLLVKAARGLTTQEAENAFTLSVIRPKAQGKKKDEWWDHNIVIEEKCKSLRKTNILEYISEADIRAAIPGNGINGIGGLENLKEWVAPLTRAFSVEAKNFGLAPPKGVLLVGVPGTGKSLFAKVTGLILTMPLLRLDMGKIFSGLVGSSEANVRMAIRVAEAMSPCVLWVDEIEKGVSGVGTDVPHLAAREAEPGVRRGNRQRRLDDPSRAPPEGPLRRALLARPSDRERAPPDHRDPRPAPESRQHHRQGPQPDRPRPLRGRDLCRLHRRRDRRRHRAGDARGVPQQPGPQPGGSPGRLRLHPAHREDHAGADHASAELVPGTDTPGQQGRVPGAGPCGYGGPADGRLVRPL